MRLQPEVPSPSAWGRVKQNDEWRPVWITLPTAEKSCVELKSGRCKGKCIPSLCHCLKNGLRCSLHCKTCKCLRDVSEYFVYNTFNSVFYNVNKEIIYSKTGMWHFYFMVKFPII